MACADSPISQLPVGLAGQDKPHLALFHLGRSFQHLAAVYDRHTHVGNYGVRIVVRQPLDGFFAAIQKHHIPTVAA